MDPDDGAGREEAMTQLTEKKVRTAEPVTPEAKPASHDTQAPKALIDFMLTEWEAPAAAKPAPIANAEAFHARRRALSALFPGQTLIVPTGHEKVRANDTLYRFRPGSDF